MLNVSHKFKNNLTITSKKQLANIALFFSACGKLFLTACSYRVLSGCLRADPVYNKRLIILGFVVK
jgi:hypothetical protein